MKEILQNIEKDIETVEGYLKRLKATRDMDGRTAFTISIYEDMLYELYSHRRSVLEYIKKETDRAP